MKKTKISLFILTLLILLGTVSQAGVYEYFPDVPPDANYAEQINFIAELEIVKGDEQDNFNPDKTITRAEFATIMCRLLGAEDEAYKITKSSFTDVPSTHWACGYVTKAVELGIVSGYGDGKFGPSDTLTYEQAVTILIRAWGYNDKALEQGGYPAGYVKVANDLGITKNTTVSDKAVLRGIVAVLIYNILFIDTAEMAY